MAQSYSIAIVFLLVAVVLRAREFTANCRFKAPGACNLNNPIS